MVKFASLAYKAPPFEAAELLSKSVLVIVIVPETPKIAPPSSVELLLTKEQLEILKFPFAKYIAPPPAALSTEFPSKVQFSKEAVAPALLLKNILPPASVVLLFKKVRFLKVTLAEVALLIVNNLPVPEDPKTEFESRPSIVKAKFLVDKF